MENKIIELPFGEKFKEIWDEHVEFVETYLVSEKEKNDLVRQKNNILKEIISECETEEKAVEDLEHQLRVAKKIYGWRQEKLRNL